MPKPSRPKPGDIRLRKDLNQPFASAIMPVGCRLRPFTDDDAHAVYDLLDAAFDDQDADFDRWWRGVSCDEEYDPALVFLAVDDEGRAAAVAQCWTSGFVKDLATAERARRQGLGEALMLMVFAAFKVRGLPHIDLKTSRFQNADAVRLYEKLGMVEVDWAG